MGGGGLCDCSSHDFARNGNCIKHWELNLHTSSVVNGIPSYIKAFRIPFQITYKSSSNFYCGSSSSPPSSATYVYAFHSQESIPPDCPTGWKSLWTGYSFTGGHDSRFSLAGLSGTGSCLEAFKPLAFMECVSVACNYTTRGDFNTWLINKGYYSAWSRKGFLRYDRYVGTRYSIGSKDTARPHISTCRVCEGNKVLFVKHSQSNTVPPIPSGWSKLWEGYSFAGGHNNVTSTNLSSIGSCLRKFIALPYTECNENNRCYYMTDKDYVNWLVTSTARSQGTRGARTEKSQISRCAVFMKD